MTDILRLSVPLSLWIAAFSGVYGLEGVVCSDLWSGAGLSLAQGRVALIAAWILAIAAHIVLLIALSRPQFGSPQPWVRRISTTLAVVALVATIWSLMPVAATSLCR